MSEKLLSILIPIYNDEKYLSHTLDSVLGAVSEENRELVEYVFINDGSTDKTHDILEEYHKRFDFVLVHQENRGAFPTTRTLIEIATGKYFITIDHDDLLAPQALDKLIGYLQEHIDKDCVIFNHCDFTDDKSKEKLYVDGCDFTSTRGQDVFVQLLKHKCYSDPLWNRIMSREIILENNAFSGNPLELDILISPIVYFAVKNVGYLPELLYKHRIHNQSLSHSAKSAWYIARCHLYAIDVWKKLIQDRRQDMSKDFVKALQTKISDTYFGAIRFAAVEDDSGSVDDELIKEIGKYSWAMKYSKWNRRYIYRPLIKLLGVKRFYDLRYSK